ncbi:MucBP domain-containing protein [Marispirochaeta sp.]|uniref:MucBP domain-containing protein n=1 Tax=Marispirochaeta sp. TaxID=2038653 RepID=UPI0029C7EA65|nr:MucBP domain-containing protein [Marispirochaeta sp.]
MRILILLISLLITPLFGEVEAKLSGSWDTLLAVRTNDSGEFLAAKNRLQPELEAFAGEFYFRTTINAEYNDRTPSETEVSIKEAYGEYTGTRFDLRAGRQIIVWGKADGVQITDIVSPKDRSQAVTLDYEDTRLPVNALKARFFGTTYTIEAIWIPFYTADAYPENSDNPLTGLIFPEEVDFGSGPQEVSCLTAEGSLPDSISDSEIGLRGSLYLPAADISFSLFSGWDNSPAYTMEINGSTITLTPDYSRIWMTGIDAAIPMGPVILRTESAWISGRSFSRTNPLESPVRTDQIKALAGIDWNPGGGWNLTGQYIEDIIPDYINYISREKRKSSATVNISKTLLRETLELSAFAVLGLQDLDSYSSCQAEYAFSDEFHLTTGGNFYMEGPDKEGEYGAYKELSSVWIRGTFSF